MSEITLDFGTTAQKRTEGDAIPVVLLALVLAINALSGFVAGKLAKGK